MRLRVLPVVVGFFVIISACQIVSSLSTSDKISGVIGFLTLTGSLPSALSGVVSLTPFGLSFLKQVPNSKEQGDHVPWRTENRMPIHSFGVGGPGGYSPNHVITREDGDGDDHDDDTENSEEDDTVKDDHEFQMHALKREDKIEKLKGDDSDEIDDEDSFQAMLIKQLATRLAKEGSKDKDAKSRHSIQKKKEKEVKGVVSKVTSLIKSFVGALEEDDDSEVFRSFAAKNAKSLADPVVAEAQETQAPAPKNKRSGRVKRQMSMSSIKVQPFYHVRDRVRSMYRPIPRPVMAPRPMVQFGTLSERDSSGAGVAAFPKPMGYDTNPWSSVTSSYGQSAPRPATGSSRVPSGGGTGTKNAGNSATSGVNSAGTGGGGTGTGGNKKGNSGSGGNKKKPAAGNSAEKESGEDYSDEESEEHDPEIQQDLGQDSGEESLGQLYEEADPASNEIEQDDEGSDENTSDYD